MEHDMIYITTNDAAQILGLQPSTLEKWRVTGDGPVFHRFGRAVRYSELELQEWAARQRRASTSDGGIEQAEAM